MSTALPMDASARQKTKAGELLVRAEQKLRQGSLADAEEISQRAADADPDCAEAFNVLGVIAHQSGRFAQALEHFGRAVALKPGIARYRANLGETCRAAGRLDDAITAGRSAIEINPNLASALSNLGIALFDQAQFKEALVYCDRAIALQGDFAQAHNNRGNVLQALDRPAEAELAYRRAIQLQPDFADAFANLGKCLRKSKRPAEAETALRRALKLKSDPETMGNLALAVQDLNRLDEAAALLRPATASDPHNARLHLHLGDVLLEQLKPDEAAAAVERAMTLDPANYYAVNLAGRIAFARGEVDAALQYYRDALALKPDLADAHNNIGNALKALGRLPEALHAYSKSLSLNPKLAGAYLNIADCKSFGPGDAHLEGMKLLAGSEGLSNNDRIQVHFALGKAYADLKEFRRSFQHLTAGNAAKRSTIAYEEAAIFALFGRIEGIFTSELIAAKTGGGDLSRLPIFVFGMPRSGTTLVEQIIASHPAVHGGGELSTLMDLIQSARRSDGKALPYPEFVPQLDAPALRQLGSHYVSAIVKRAPNKECITDKMPSNFQFAGLIHLALPNAKIIHTVRSPLDTCVSCFSKLFSGEQNHTYDLGEVGRYYRRYERLMAHWRRVLPVGRMLEVRYEDIVADLEGQARRIVAHCDLPWDERCLSFHETSRPVRTASATQVRQPIYRSAIGRWRVYGEQLEPLLNALGTSTQGDNPQ